MKKKVCTDECPLPICNLPDLLSAKQMRMAMIHLGLINKEIATDLNMNVSTVLGIHTAQKYSDVNKRRVSDYLKAKLTEKKPNA